MFDLYTEITNRLIAEMESGKIPWHKPWSDSGALAVSHVTGKPYSLLNQILLNGKAGEWLTFRQAQQEGGTVRQGEKSRFVVFWKWLDKADSPVKVLSDGTEVREQIPYLKYIRVFHISQCDGIKPRYAVADRPPVEPCERAEQISDGYVKRSGVTLISHESGRAFYRPATDTVVVPHRQQFDDTPSYYGTLFHELAHSTGHPKRLNRITECAAFGSEAYSQEELVAELSSAFLTHVAGLETYDSLRSNAAYLQGWLSALKNDKRLIVYASAKADKAVQMILGEQDAPDCAGCLTDLELNRRKEYDHDDDL